MQASLAVALSMICATTAPAGGDQGSLSTQPAAIEPDEVTSIYRRWGGRVVLRPEVTDDQLAQLGEGFGIVALHYGAWTDSLKLHLTDEGLAHIARLKGTRITDTGLEHLRGAGSGNSDHLLSGNSDHIGVCDFR